MISGVLFAIASLLFLLVAFGTKVGDDINLLALGLMFLAAGLTVWAFGLGNKHSSRIDGR